MHINNEFGISRTANIKILTIKLN